MKAPLYYLLLGTALTTCLTSCQIEQPAPVPQVPEMPYRPRVVTTPATEEVQTTTWDSAPEPSPYISSTADGAMAPRSAPVAPPPIPDPVQPAPRQQEPADAVPPIKPLDMTDFSSSAAPAAASTPAPKPAAQSGPIPIAARVEGDPTHVWNPQAPSKTIRIVDPKTGQPFPSGKKLKVRGRDGNDFYFIVP